MVDSVVPPVPGPFLEGEVAAPAAAWVELIVFVTARAYRALVITLVVVASVPALWNWTSHVVRSGSMEPHVGVGGVVIGRPFTSAEDVPVGRVMVFTDPASPPQEERLLVHRVVSDLGDGTWVTRGDANADNDTTPVTRESFRARAMILVPFVGKPWVWLTEGNLAALTGWLLLTTAAFVLAGRRRSSDRGGRPPRRSERSRRRGPARRRRGDRDVRRGTERGMALRRAVRVALPLVLVTVATASWSGTAGAAFSTRTTNAGNTWTVSTTLSTRVTLNPPGDAVRGTVPVTASLTTVSTDPWAVRIEYAVSGTSTWRTLCTDSTAPYSCDWVTTTFSNQDYDLRAVSTSESTTVVSDTVAGVQVDNAAPTVLMQDPGSPLRGTITLTASAGDADSGVAQVVIQYAAAGSATWRDVCTTSAVPATCRFDTTSLSDGSYSFRAIAVDVAGNSATATAITGRTVDNRVASVSLTDPGASLNGNVTVQASAHAPAGIASVRIQRAPAGTSTWTDICTDTTSPYSCAWDTTGVANGGYDLRAILRDTAGTTTTSAVLSNRRVDNNSLGAGDVQTLQGGSSTGKIEAGDRVLLTYTSVARTSTIATGWDGSPTTVLVRVRDGGLLGLGTKDDTLDVLRNGSAVNLGSVNLGENYIGNSRSAGFAATMTATTVVVNGVSSTRVTLVLGNQTSGKALSATTTPGAMVWTPSASVSDLNGRPGSAAPRTETGPLDRDF